MSALQVLVPSCRPAQTSHRGCRPCREDPDAQGAFPTLVVSMLGSTERRAAMQQRLEAVGASYAFIDAIDSRQQLSPEQARAVQPTGSRSCCC